MKWIEDEGLVIGIELEVCSLGLEVCEVCFELIDSKVRLVEI